MTTSTRIGDLLCAAGELEPNELTRLLKLQKASPARPLGVLAEEAARLCFRPGCQSLGMTSLDQRTVLHMLTLIIIIGLVATVGCAHATGTSLRRS